jgi:Calx-beta domain
MGSGRDILRRSRLRARRRAHLPWLESVEPRILLANFLVTTTSDSPVASPTPDVPHPFSLRQAIEAANATPGPDTISFGFPAKDIPGVVDYNAFFQVWRVHVDSVLPTIARNVAMDGYSQKSLTGSQGVNAVQSLTLGGGVAGGTFTLTFDGATTDPINFNASADEVGKALQALPTVGAGNVVVSADQNNDPVNAGVLTIKFQNGLGDTAIVPISGDGGGLIGVAPVVITDLTTQGVNRDITSDQNALEIGFNAKVRVIVDGSSPNLVTGDLTPADFPGLTIASDHNTIRGLSIDGFSTGILVQGPSAIGNLIQGNYVGRYVLFPKPELNITSATVAGIGNSGIGIEIAAPTNNTIGGVVPETHNAIASNGSSGVVIASGAFGNEVSGNLIGVLQQDSKVYFQAGNAGEGLLIKSSSNVIGGFVRGATNVVSANELYGIHVVGEAAFDNQIYGNYVGTDPGGTFVFGQGFPGNGQNEPASAGNLRDGIFLDDAPRNQVGSVGNTFASGNGASNVISGNFGDGVRVLGVHAISNSIEGNFIGANLAGTSSLPNFGDGVGLFSSNTVVSGNLIAGNERGVFISGPGASNNQVTANSIGTDAKGTYKLGNSLEGVRIEDASNNVIGGLGSSGNLISGNNTGVAIVGLVVGAEPASNNLVSGNVIGTDAKMTYALGNSLHGVLLDNASNNTIGGSISGARNVISGNHWGVTITGSAAAGNLVQGDFIGTDPTRSARLGNEVNGVLIATSAAGNQIGGPAAFLGNTIAYNLRDGVRVESNGSIANSILSNLIFMNGSAQPGGFGIGINLVGPNDLPSGVTPNTPGSPHVGPNDLQSFPVLSLVTSNRSASTSVEGSLNSIPNTTFTLQFFSNPVLDPSGFGQGQFLLGTDTVRTDAAGDAVFSFLFNTPTPAGRFVTATATDPTGNTSEFSAATPVQQLAGKLQFSAASYVVLDTSGAATITVDRVGGSSGAVTIHFATSDATPNAQTEYVPTSGTLVFNDGETVKTFTIPLIATNQLTVDQAVNLTLSNPTGGASLGSPSTSVLVIRNSNAPAFGGFQFSSTVYAAPGGSGSVLITVTRVGGFDGLATVDFATGGGTEIAGVDYAPESGTLMFPVGVISRTFLVPIFDRANIVGDRTIGLTLSHPTGGAVLGFPSTATITIHDTVGPTVSAVQLIKNRLGWVTGLNVVYSEPLNPQTATNLLNYGFSVRTAGRDHRFGDHDDLLIPIIAATYIASTNTVTLTLGRAIHPPTPFRFAINESTDVPGVRIGVSDVAGNLLDGNFDGAPGGPYVAFLIGKDGGVVAPSQLPHATQRSLVKIQAHVGRMAAAVDSLRESGGVSRLMHAAARRARTSHTK